MKYIVIHANMEKSLRVGMQFIHNGATSRQGWKGTITGINTASNMNRFTVCYACGTIETYCKSWFMRSIALSYDDIVSMSPFDGRSYVYKYRDFTFHAGTFSTQVRLHPAMKKYVEEERAAKKEAAEQAKKVAMIKEAKAVKKANDDLIRAQHQAKIEARNEAARQPYHYLSHTFTMPTNKQSGGKWVAVQNGSPELASSTQEGLKAKIALAFAENNLNEYEIFCKVGEAKAAPVTVSKVLKFYNLS
jgi:hypothetical protein